MAPSVQQGPNETTDFSSIEQAVTLARLMKGIEVKVAADMPLNTEEMTYLFELDKPLYDRTRDDWPWGMYGDEDPELADRLDRYDSYKRATRQSSIEALTEQYGDDTVWLMSSYGEVKNRVEELLGAGADPLLLAKNLLPIDRIRHFEALNAAGADLNARAVFEAHMVVRRSSFDDLDAIAPFIRTHAAELIGIEDVDSEIVFAFFRDGEVANPLETTAKLLALGVARPEIVRSISKEVVEASLGQLLAQGFAPAELYSRCSNTFILDNFDTFYQDSQDRVVNMYRGTIDEADLTNLVIQLHAKGQPVEAQLQAMNRGQHYSKTAQYEQLVAAGVAVDDIIASFTDDENLIFMYADWFMNHGADGETIKAKMSPYGVVVKRVTLREAGIPVDIQHYLRQLPPSTLLLLEVELQDEPGAKIDYNTLLDMFDTELTLDYAVRFIKAGVDSAKVFEKLAVGEIVNDYYYEHFIAAGVPADEVFAKASEAYKRGVYWLALQNPESADSLFVEALSTLPADAIIDAIDHVVKRSQHIHLLVDRLAEKHGVDHRMEFLFEHGADINYIVQHVSKGSYKLYNEAEWLLDNGVDAGALFELLQPKLKGFQSPEKFIEAGVSAELVFDAVGTWYVLRNFEALSKKYDKKMLATRVMAEPSAGFIVEHLHDLTALGWSADELSGHLESRQIFDAIEAFMLAGLSPAIAITHVMQVHRGRSQADCEEILTSRLGVAL